jgi:CRISPR/Cas system-associated exonuclease Cas4 (RecB family)
MSVRDAVLRGADIHEARKDWGFDRTTYLNSSEADACIRSIWYSKHRPGEAAAQDWGFARRGHAVERYVIDSLSLLNDVSLDLVGTGQVSLQDEKRRLSATPDGVIRFGDGDWLGLEVKSIDPRTNTGRLPKPAHITQLRIAMALLNQKTDYKLSQGYLLYVDASNFNRMFEFVIDADDSILDVYANKAKRVFSAVSDSVLDREGKRTGECKYCPFTAICGVAAEESRTPRPKSRPGGFDTAVLRYVELQDTEAAIKAEKDSLKEDMKQALQSAGPMIVGNIEVSMSLTKGRASLDRKAVAAAGIDLTPFEKVGAPVERLNVKRVN